MLEFDPNKRVTAAEAIMNDYFDDIRLPEQESVEPPKLTIEVDGFEDLSLEELRLQVYETIKDLTSDKFDFTQDHSHSDSF